VGSVNAYSTLTYNDGDAPVVDLNEALEKKLETLAYDILERHCPGDWCNNDGGFGRIVIQLGEEVETTLEFSQRVTSTEDSTVVINEEDLHGLIENAK
jgi:hypothetical protein